MRIPFIGKVSQCLTGIPLGCDADLPNHVFDQSGFQCLTGIRFRCDNYIVQGTAADMMFQCLTGIHSPPGPPTSHLPNPTSSQSPMPRRRRWASSGETGCFTSTRKALPGRATARTWRLPSS